MKKRGKKEEKRNNTLVLGILEIHFKLEQHRRSCTPLNSERKKADLDLDGKSILTEQSIAEL